MLDSISNLVSGQTGINSNQLLTELVAASREPKEQALNQKLNLNSARISALGSAKSALATFASALKEVTSGNAFLGEPKSSDPTHVSAKYTSSQAADVFPLNVKVIRNASPQRLLSDMKAGDDTAIGTGTLSFNLPLHDGGTNFDVTIDSSNNTLAGLRDAINAAGEDKGITAQITYERRGARLQITGPTGNRGGFEIASSDSSINEFAWPPIGTAGQDYDANATTANLDQADYTYNLETDGAMRILTDEDVAAIEVDGIRHTSLNNIFENIYEGIDLTLNNAEIGKTVQITGEPPENTSADFVREFVDAYNELRGALNNISAPGIDGASGGPLSGERSIRDLKSRLGNITSTIISSDGPYRTLADIGVRTERDGTLSIDTERLDRILDQDPTALRNLIDPEDENTGVAALINTISESMSGDEGSLSLAQERYQQLSEKYAEALEKVAEDSERYRELLSSTFANMDRQLSLLNSTQSYLDQQIAIWNNSDN